MHDASWHRRPWRNGGIIVFVLAAHLAAFAWAARPAPPVIIEPATIVAELIAPTAAEEVAEPEAAPPESEPVLEPEPEPQPTPEPEPEPVVEPEPAPEPEPIVEPDPEPAPVVVPKPKPKPKPKPRPKPVSKPAPRPVPMPAAPTKRSAAPTKAPTASPVPRPPTAGPRTTLPSSSAAYLNNSPPRYPPRSKRLGEQGRVVIAVLIGVDGRAQQARIKTSSGHRQLDETALRTARDRWRYKPGTRNGVPTAMWFDVPINFVLE